MKLMIKERNMIALAIVAMGALVAIGGKLEELEPPVCEAKQVGQSDEMPPVLCDPKRCGCGSNLAAQADDQLYCIMRDLTLIPTFETRSLACIDHWRYCTNDDIKLCHRGACIAGEERPEMCTRQIEKGDPNSMRHYQGSRMRISHKHY